MLEGAVDGRGEGRTGVRDWLEMPSHNADGDVEQIGLTTVKVRNWDKTITTIPTDALITELFKNWRGMSESGGRRIKRSLLMDVSSIRLCDEAMLKSFGEIEDIEAHIRKRSRGGCLEQRTRRDRRSESGQRTKAGERGFFSRLYRSLAAESS